MDGRGPAPGDARMTEQDAVDAIRATHLKANIGVYENPPSAWHAACEAHWERAWIDPGGTIFGPGPYAKLPITLGVNDEIVIRVYPPARLRKRLAKNLAASAAAGSSGERPTP